MQITLEQVSYEYGTNKLSLQPALQDINLTIDAGEFVGIMGQTGCGKSTLLQIVAGLLKPVAGKVLLDDEDIYASGYQYEKLRDSLGMVFQYPEYQLFETTVEKEVAFGLKHRGLSKTEIKEQVQQALELVGFDYEQMKNQSPLALSGGEKRRIAIADVLVRKPKILLFDEPLAGLDGQNRKQFLELVKTLHEEGITIVMISHDIDSLCEYADKILVMQNGSIAMEGTVPQIYADLQKVKEMNIGISETIEIASLLQEAGSPIGNDITRYHELLEAITAWKGGKAQ